MGSDGGLSLTYRMTAGGIQTRYGNETPVPALSGLATMSGIIGELTDAVGRVQQTHGVRVELTHNNDGIRLDMYNVDPEKLPLVMDQMLRSKCDIYSVEPCDGGGWSMAVEAALNEVGRTMFYKRSRDPGSWETRWLKFSDRDGIVFDLTPEG